MSENEIFNPQIEIELFKKQMLEKYNQHIYVYTVKQETRNIDIDTIKQAAWSALVESHPEFRKYHNKNFSTKTRKRQFILHMQIFFFYARKEGYSFHYIADNVDRTHATILNGVRQIENQMFTGNEECNKALVNINKKLEEYVGTVPEDYKSKDKSKSSPDPIWDEARRFLAKS